jgi:hypothetical protein
MKYYFRHLKIVKINGKDKNYPFNKLLRSNDDDGYSIIDNNAYFKETANDILNNCIKYNSPLFKYQDKYIETSNVIEIALNEFKEISKHKGTVYAGYETYEHHGPGCMTIYRKDNPPNPFNSFDYRTNNRYDIRTKTNNLNKHEIFIGLYKYNELTKEYEFILHSLYNKDNSMYYAAT